MKKALALAAAVCLAFAGGCGDTINNYWGFPDGGSAADMPIRETQITEVLDGEELNIGNSAEVISLGGFPLPGLASDPVGEGVEVRILEDQGSSQRGQMITIAVIAALKHVPGLIGGDVVSPVVGILEFGSGGVSHRVEFDIPSGDRDAPLAPPFDVIPNDGGVIISFPASSFRLLARNDARRAATSLGRVQIGNAVWKSTGGIMDVHAFAAYSTRASIVPVRLMVPLALDNSVPGVVLGPGTNYAIPTFAKKVIFRRNPIAAPLNIFFFDSGGRRADTFVVPAGVNAPNIDVPGQAVSFQIQTAGVGVNELYGDFEIQL